MSKTCADQPFGQRTSLVRRSQRRCARYDAAALLKPAIEPLEGDLGTIDHGLDGGVRSLAAYCAGVDQGERRRRQPVQPRTVAHSPHSALGKIPVGIPDPHAGQLFAKLGTKALSRRRQGCGAAYQLAQAQRFLFLICRPYSLVITGDRFEVLLKCGGCPAAHFLEVAEPVVVLAPLLVLALEVGNEAFLVFLRIVDDAGEPIKPGLAEAVEDDIERGALFANEQYTLAPAGIVRNQVGNRLRLTCAGGTLDDEAASGPRQRDGRVLCGVSRNHIPLLGWWDRGRCLLDEGARFDRKDLIEGWLSHRPVDQLREVADKRHLLVVQVGERDLGEVDFPREFVPCVTTLGICQRLGLRDHVVAPRAQRAACRQPLRQRRRLHELFEQSMAQGAVVVASIAEVCARAHRLPRELPAPIESVDPLYRLLEDQPDLRPLLRCWPHPRLAILILPHQV